MGTTIGEVILSSNGFAEVYPEHKFQSECQLYGMQLQLQL